MISVTKLFYGPGDWLSQSTSRRTRIALATWLLILFIFPGIPIWYFFKNAIWLIGFMSILALILAMWSVVSAETPVEQEGQKEN